MAGISDIYTGLQNAVKGINSIVISLNQVFPRIIGTSSTATGGAATLPANPVGFLTLVDPSDGSTKKVAYYDV